jgi:solute carrier family 6 GABA transporter-like protein 1
MANGTKQAIMNLSQSLTNLAIPFCEPMFDAALLGVMGRRFPHLRTLNVRGNSNLSSFTGWYDGRATIVPAVSSQALFVLARYSNISKSSLEDTKRIHPLQAMKLSCILDSEDMGKGIQRT